MTALEIKKKIEEENPRSAWDKGVKEYALELADELAEYERHAGKPVPQGDRKALKEALLNGADSWSQYSNGGCSLIYDGDIAERLCSPSELKKRKGGEYAPNRNETWLDVQARALWAAEIKIRKYFLS